MLIQRRILSLCFHGVKLGVMPHPVQSQGYEAESVDENAWPQVHNLPREARLWDVQLGNPEAQDENRHNRGEYSVSQGLQYDPSSILPVSTR